MPERVLITGADGFTGHYLAAELSAHGYEVHGLVRYPVAGPLAGFSALHVADLSDTKAMAAVMREVLPQKVAHLAGISFVGHEDVQAIYQTNIVGTRNLLQALAQEARDLDAVLLPSSANVYGNATGGLLRESTPMAPANDYAVSKIAMEYVAHLYAPRLPIVLVRPFNYTGIGQDESFLLPKIVSHLRRRAGMIELGNLDVARDFSDVRMVVEWYRRLLECPDAKGKTLNVCSGRAYTLKDVLAMAREVSGQSLEVRINSAFVRESEVKTLYGSRDLLVATIGPVSDIPLKDTLAWMLS
jgi:GDP-6-deoxy-D-talose 4-dehydrogenase